MKVFRQAHHLTRDAPLSHEGAVHGHELHDPGHMMRSEAEGCEALVRDLAVQGDSQDQLAQSLIESLGQVD
eukprot:903442-Pyramimonas_sp.AAC.1